MDQLREVALPIGLRPYGRTRTFQSRRFLFSSAVLGGAAIALAPPALGDASVSVGWRPTERRAYVFHGSSDSKFGWAEVASDERPDVGTRNSHGEAERFEADASWDVSDSLALTARVSGGRFRLKVTDTDATRAGQDYAWDVGARLATPVSGEFSIHTLAGVRVRRRWSEEGAPPATGNAGLVLGVRPVWSGLSLLVEATLAAVPLGTGDAWGIQKDSSALRVRPEYEVLSGSLRPYVALEYFHTHTEWFGTTLAPGEDAVMLDDYELSAVVGGRYVF